VVRPVELVEVDVIGPQTLQTFVSCREKGSVSEVPRQRLRGDKNTVPDTAGGFADDLFGSVRLGRIDQTGPEVDASPEGRRTALIPPGPKSDLGQPQRRPRELLVRHAGPRHSGKLSRKRARKCSRKSRLASRARDQRE